MPRKQFASKAAGTHTHFANNDNNENKIPIQSSININTRYDRYPLNEPVPLWPLKMNSMWTEALVLADGENKSASSFSKRIIVQQMRQKNFFFQKKKENERTNEMNEKKK